LRRVETERLERAIAYDQPTSVRWPHPHDEPIPFATLRRTMTNQGGRMGELAMFSSSTWQMSYGERAAIEGVLAQLRPRLALEIGTAEGGSLARVAQYSDEVHSFDLVRPSEEVAVLDNVTCHTGDGHALLPAVLAELAAAGREIDFVLVDGDHSAEGVQRDIEDILDSDAVQRTIVLAHDTMNDVVRSGIESVAFDHYSKVALVDLDFVPGYLARSEPYRLQLWGGLGLIIVDADRAFNQNGPIREGRFHDLPAVVRSARDVMVELELGGRPLEHEQPSEIEKLLRDRWRSDARELEVLSADLATAKRRLIDIEGSLSWRGTQPLRTMKRAWRARRGS
jgi:hypothetical protein